ncbi:hypothetical protein [Lapillicoccus sp.]|uniref:hypothetical protein n=1 Tax=Lapillicoccus sp. TaxID=1909287 RepID=UPI0025EE9298|nr:hypothetical protein [Lapillicoccus sp.]
MSDAALVTEAMSRSGILWIEVPDDRLGPADRVGPADRAWPAWFAWEDDTAYVVNGLGEQYLPWLPEFVVLVLRSKDTGGRLLRVRARAQVLIPDAPAWGSAVAALRAARLNAVDDVEERWRTDCAVTSLTPVTGAPTGLVEGPGHYDDGSGAAEPAPTRATTATWHPKHWRGRPARRRGTR